MLGPPCDGREFLERLSVRVSSRSCGTLGFWFTGAFGQKAGFRSVVLSGAWARLASRSARALPQDLCMPKGTSYPIVRLPKITRKCGNELSTVAVKNFISTVSDQVGSCESGPQ